MSKNLNKKIETSFRRENRKLVWILYVNIFLCNLILAYMIQKNLGLEKSERDFSMQGFFHAYGEWMIISALGFVNIILILFYFAKQRIKINVILFLCGITRGSCIRLQLQEFLMLYFIPAVSAAILNMLYLLAIHKLNGWYMSSGWLAFLWLGVYYIFSVLFILCVLNIFGKIKK